MRHLPLLIFEFVVTCASTSAFSGTLISPLTSPGLLSSKDEGASCVSSFQNFLVKDRREVDLPVELLYLVTLCFALLTE